MRIPEGEIRDDKVEDIFEDRYKDLKFSKNNEKYQITDSKRETKA